MEDALLLLEDLVANLTSGSLTFPDSHHCTRHRRS